MPKILVFLRQQALFNQLLSSCIRNNGSSNTRNADYEHLLVFEISAFSCQYINVSMEHPYDESVAMVQFDLRLINNVQARVFCNTHPCEDWISNRISLIIQNTLSIPVTLRELNKIWEEEYEAKFKRKLGTGGSNGGIDDGNFSLPMGPDDGGGSGSGGSAETGSMAGSGGPGMNGQLNGSLNGTGIVHQEFCDSKAVKLEPIESGKRRRVGEDFCSSPKSSKIENECDNSEEVDEEDDDDEFDESTNLSSGDSNNSLGENQVNVANQMSSSSSTGLSASATSMGPMGATTGLVGESTALGCLDFSNLSSGLVRSSSRDDAASGMGEPDIVSLNHLPKSIEEKPSFASSVSITPIAVGKQNTMSNSMLNNIGLDKRSGIEIIPLANASSNMASSITITPIPVGTPSSSSKSSSSSSGSSDKKLSGSSNLTGLKKNSSSSETDRHKLEKRKKRKHDEHLSQLQMGPPHKIPSKSSYDGPSSPSGTSRKFSASPVPSKSSSSTNSLILSGGSPGGSKSSPKHSPVHHSSPKHQSNYGTSSPKHLSGGSSGGGKPSMSALKSAASSSSPNSKSSSSSIGGKEESGSSLSGSGSKSSGSGGSSSSKERDRDRDRDRERDREKKSGYSSSSSSSSPKLKTPAIKLKQLDLANCGASLNAGVHLELMNSNSSGGSSAGSGSIDLTDSGLVWTGATDLSKNSSAAAASAAGMLLLQHAMKNRKGSLSAVIDKLKSAQSGDEGSLVMLPELAQQAGFTTAKAASSSTTPTSATSVSSEF